MDEANIYHSKDIDSLLPSKEVQEKINKSMLLAQKIFKAIKAKGWNKSDFAEAMGVKNLSIISKWLSGTNNFETNTLFDIEKVLDIEL
ncbi:MAG TPA: helix-turn-helix transcriptional regulator, partial [Parafilimonas sp.]|nr:helix-turn-helix transcriptional regulator [Parafilimonas sp.]